MTRLLRPWWRWQIKRLVKRRELFIEYALVARLNDDGDELEKARQWAAETSAEIARLERLVK